MLGFLDEATGVDVETVIELTEGVSVGLSTALLITAWSRTKHGRNCLACMGLTRC